MTGSSRLMTCEPMDPTTPLEFRGLGVQGLEFLGFGWLRGYYYPLRLKIGS